MKNIIICILCILALCSITLAQKMQPQPLGPGAGCQWQAQCGGGGFCIFNPSPGIGCDVITCQECFRGLLAKPTDPKALDLTRQFVGRFLPYRYRQYTAMRFVVLMPGPLARFGVESGDVVSRIGKARVTRRLMLRALSLKGARLTIYTPGKNRVRRVRL